MRCNSVYLRCCNGALSVYRDSRHHVSSCWLILTLGCGVRIRLRDDCGARDLNWVTVSEQLKYECACNLKGVFIVQVKFQTEYMNVETCTFEKPRLELSDIWLSLAVGSDVINNHVRTSCILEHFITSIISVNVIYQSYFKLE